MKDVPPIPAVDQEALLALMGALRPELHRYCARLVGSVFDGEDIVQDTFVRALTAVPDLVTPSQVRPWLFRIAHNRALDFLRTRARRMTESMDVGESVAEEPGSGPEDVMVRHDAVNTAISRFVELPTSQRSVVVLKDVLGHSLGEIAGLLDMTIAAVKATLHRGRARLREINARPAAEPATRSASQEVIRYVAMFNGRDWDALRALLADDVRLNQSSRPARVGAAEVGSFFTNYSNSQDWHLVPAWLEGREVIAVFRSEGDAKPGYVMQLDWRDGRISAIRDFRYIRYVIDDVEVQLSPSAGRDRSA